MCVVADNVGIRVHTNADKADVFTMNLMNRNAIEEKIDERMPKAFSSGSVEYR